MWSHIELAYCFFFLRREASSRFEGVNIVPWCRMHMFVDVRYREKAMTSLAGFRVEGIVDDVVAMVSLELDEDALDSFFWAHAHEDLEIRFASGDGWRVWIT